MTHTEPMVEGEPARLILEGLLTITSNLQEDEDGTVRVDVPLNGDAGAAVVHALGRVTAELRAADMRSFIPGGTRSSRTEDQRGFDALILLTQRLAEAMSIEVEPLHVRSP